MSYLRQGNVRKSGRFIMRVKCTSNLGVSFPKNYINAGIQGYDVESRFPLTPGNEYVVYALALRDAGQVWYYICDDQFTYYPVHYPAPLFEVVNKKVSRYWQYSYTPNYRDHLSLFAFEDWIADRLFYDRLTDGNETEVKIFTNWKSIMDIED